MSKNFNIPDGCHGIVAQKLAHRIAVTLGTRRMFAFEEAGMDIDLEEMIETVHDEVQTVIDNIVKREE
jgi:hypothetical protein